MKPKKKVAKKAAKKRVRRPNPPKLFVAVVVRANGPSRRALGDWAAFAAETAEDAIGRALEANRQWGGTYTVLVGTLTGRAVPISKYRTERITNPVAGLEPQ